jgi:hypothetical protein
VKGAACASSETGPVQEDASAVYNPRVCLRLVTKDSTDVGLFMVLKEISL